MASMFRESAARTSALTRYDDSSLRNTGIPANGADHPAIHYHLHVLQ